MLSLFFCSVWWVAIFCQCIVHCCMKDSSVIVGNGVGESDGNYSKIFVDL